MKKILIKNHDCCYYASVGYSTYRQLKSDKDFEDINVEHKICKSEDLEVYIDDNLFWNWNKKGSFTHASTIVKIIKENYDR